MQWSYKYKIEEWVGKRVVVLEWYGKEGTLFTRVHAET